MYTISQYKDSNLFYVRISNESHYLELIDFIEKLTQIIDDFTEIRVISDYLDLDNIYLNAEFLNEISDSFNILFADKFSSILWAHVSDKPIHIAGSLIFGNMVAHKTLVYKQFSTLEVASEWLGVTSALKELVRKESILIGSSVMANDRLSIS